MSNSTEEFIDAFVYSMYGKCQIQMVNYARFTVFRAKVEKMFTNMLYVQYNMGISFYILSIQV